MTRDPDNPWAIHLYTHLMEAGTEAGVAVAPAQKLQYLVPGAPHLQVCMHIHDDEAAADCCPAVLLSAGSLKRCSAKQGMVVASRLQSIGWMAVL